MSYHSNIQYINSGEVNLNIDELNINPDVTTIEARLFGSQTKAVGTLPFPLADGENISGKLTSTRIGLDWVQTIHVTNPFNYLGMYKREYLDFAKVWGEWKKISDTDDIASKNKDVTIKRNDTNGLTEPTLAEFNTPNEGDTAQVILKNSSIEYWVYQNGSWNLLTSILPIDGNDRHIVRNNTTPNVAPTGSEAPSPTDGDTAKVKLSDNTVEFWSYSTSWTRNFFIQGKRSYLYARKTTSQSINANTDVTFDTGTSQGTKITKNANNTDFTITPTTGQTETYRILVNLNYINGASCTFALAGAGAAATQTINAASIAKDAQFGPATTLFPQSAVVTEASTGVINFAITTSVPVTFKVRCVVSGGAATLFGSNGRVPTIEIEEI